MIIKNHLKSRKKFQRVHGNRTQFLGMSFPSSLPAKPLGKNCQGVKMFLAGKIAEMLLPET